MPLRQVMNYPNGEEVAMVDKLHLTNMLRAKVEHNLDGGFSPAIPVHIGTLHS